jgi:hypothetical protein
MALREYLIRTGWAWALPVTEHQAGDGQAYICPRGRDHRGMMVDLLWRLACLDVTNAITLLWPLPMSVSRVRDRCPSQARVTL